MSQAITPVAATASTSTPASSPGVLSYQTTDGPAATSPKWRRRWRIVSLLMLWPGLAVPFVPFACNIVPAQLVTESAVAFTEPAPLQSSDEITGGLLALPTFLAFPLVALAVIRLVRDRAPRSVAAAIGVSGLLAGLSFAASLVILMREGNPDAYEWALVIGAAGLLGLSLVTAIVLAVRRAPPEARAAAAASGPYAAMLLFCLFAWHDNAEAGWYLSLAPAAAALAELVGQSVRAFRHASVAEPPPSG